MVSEVEFGEDLSKEEQTLCSEHAAKTVKSLAYKYINMSSSFEKRKRLIELPLAATEGIALLRRLTKAQDLDINNLITDAIGNVLRERIPKLLYKKYYEEKKAEMLRVKEDERLSLEALRDVGKLKSEWF